MLPPTLAARGCPPFPLVKQPDCRCVQNASSQPSRRARTRPLAGRGMPKGGSHPLMHRLAAPLRCSLVLSLTEKEQLTTSACSGNAAGSHPTFSISATAAQRFRLCGGGQRAFRSPFGNLRFPPVGEKEQSTTPACFISAAGSHPALSINVAAAQSFRLCGGGQRAFRSPFGNLRPLRLEEKHNQ